MLYPALSLFKLGLNSEAFHFYFTWIIFWIEDFLNFSQEHIVDFNYWTQSWIIDTLGIISMDQKLF